VSGDSTGRTTNTNAAMEQEQPNKHDRPRPIAPDSWRIVAVARGDWHKFRFHLRGFPDEWWSRAGKIANAQREGRLDWCKFADCVS